MRSVASREACGVVTQPPVPGGQREAGPVGIGAKAMEAAKSLEAQP
jgi:hypothetical protein